MKDYKNNTLKENREIVAQKYLENLVDSLVQQYKKNMNQILDSKIAATEKVTFEAVQEEDISAQELVHKKLLKSN